jgi:hypothetical protein
VKASDIVGFWFVLQQTPREIIVAPPSLVTSPPQIAEFDVTLEMDADVKVGIEIPVAVPSLRQRTENPGSDLFSGE